MVRRGLVESRDRARQAIEAGRVVVGGAPALKPARLVQPDEPIRLVGPGPRFVSRGGEKLDAALDRFGVDVSTKRILDAGASTGGFTDCVLQRGADRVVAVDVGYGQLHERLRQDARVEIHERTNMRTVDAGVINGTVDCVVGDLSFISLRTVAANLVQVCRPQADLVLLVKPQFEAGRTEASRGRGVITDPEVWRRTLLEVGRTLGERGAAIMGVMVSPLRGAEGNVEFLVHAVADRGGIAEGDLEALVDRAVEAAQVAAAGDDDRPIS